MWTKKFDKEGKEAVYVPPTYAAQYPARENRIKVDAENFAEYLKNTFPFTKGDLITFKHYAHQKGVEQTIYLVLRVEEDFEKLLHPRTDAWSGHPNCMHITNRFRENPYGFERWDNMDSYRTLNEEELAVALEKYRDNIQNYLKHHG